MSLKEIFHDDNKLISISRSGITKKDYFEIVESTGIAIGTFAQVTHLTPRTLQRKKMDEFVSPEASERAILIGKLYYTGEKVFGNKEKFKTWMKKPNNVLNGKIPNDLLDTITGIGIINDELLRIEYGIVS
ncbi:MAG: DUF2384 domain-containing protein [Bacteroidales bacterium]|nr:DUF2384 domain-containing protein [Bacteroidales bacterium]